MKRLLIAAAALVAVSCAPGAAGRFAVLDATATPLVDGAFVSAPFPTHDASGAIVPAAVEWTPFPAREQLVVQFQQLPHAPRTVAVWLSFGPSGEGAGLASGDLARVQAFDDPAFVPAGSPLPATTPASSVTLYNGTEQDYFIRVVVE